MTQIYILGVYFFLVYAGPPYYCIEMHTFVSLSSHTVDIRKYRKGQKKNSSTTVRSLVLLL
jgi:hypothetical protein